MDFIGVLISSFSFQVTLSTESTFDEFKVSVSEGISSPSIPDFKLKVCSYFPWLLFFFMVVPDDVRRYDNVFLLLNTKELTSLPPYSLFTSRVSLDMTSNQMFWWCFAVSVWWFAGKSKGEGREGSQKTDSEYWKIGGYASLLQGIEYSLVWSFIICDGWTSGSWFCFRPDY